MLQRFLIERRLRLRLWIYLRSLSFVLTVEIPALTLVRCPERWRDTQHERSSEAARWRRAVRRPSTVFRGWWNSNQQPSRSNRNRLKLIKTVFRSVVFANGSLTRFACLYLAVTQPFINMETSFFHWIARNDTKHQLQKIDTNSITNSKMTEKWRPWNTIIVCNSAIY